jgi:hypothetical protein
LITEIVYVISSPAVYGHCEVIDLSIARSNTCHTGTVSSSASSSCSGSFVGSSSGVLSSSIGGSLLGLVSSSKELISARFVRESHEKSSSIVNVIDTCAIAQPDNTSIVVVAQVVHSAVHQACGTNVNHSDI